MIDEDEDDNDKNTTTTTKKTTTTTTTTSTTTTTMRGEDMGQGTRATRDNNDEVEVDDEVVSHAIGGFECTSMF